MNHSARNREEKSRQAGQDGTLITLIKGGLVGIANIIPGVSGGSFALILGIFDRLVGALNNIGPRTVQAALRLVTGRFRDRARSDFLEELRRIDASFLVTLIVGSLISILACSFLIDYLLQEHYSPTLAFFIGLILPSILVPWRMMARRGALILWAIPGMALTVGVSLVIPDNAAGADNLLVALGTGAVAISAMILPGISGSFVMLVLGQYQNVIGKITALQLGLVEGQIDFGALFWLGALAVGMGVGILAFARLLNFLLARFRSATMAFLIGLLLGSLWVLWPFKDISAGAQVTGRSGELKQEVRIATAPNRLPDNPREALIALAAVAAGLAGSAGMVMLGGTKKGEAE